MRSVKQKLIHRLGLGIIGFWACSMVVAKTSINTVRVWPSPETVRVVFDLGSADSAKVYTQSNPYRIVVEFPDAILRAPLQQLKLQNTGIVAVRSQRTSQSVSIVLETESPVMPTTFTLKPNQHYGHRVVVDWDKNDRQAILKLFDLSGDMGDVVAATAPVTVAASNAKMLVAIDAGHGGEDPGAIGPRGTKEKDVVLAIAHQLHKRINQERNMQSFLIRKGDYYIGLRERMQRARLQKADLLVSIHADAFKNPKSEGASVFVLSDYNASSNFAQWLARSENQSDQIGGIKLEDSDEALASVLFDLSRKVTNADSCEAAQAVLEQLGKSVKLHKNHIERARFAVLKAPDMPSILVETGFISNPKTEVKLRDKRYQRKIAESVFKGIQTYQKSQNFQLRKKHYPSVQPVQMTPIAKTIVKAPAVPEKKHTKQSQVAKLYTVKKGDTLGKIAKKHKLSVAQLMSQNHLRTTKIKIGQKLAVT